MNRKKQHVVHVIFSPHIGGSEMCAIEICSHLDQEKYSPSIFFMHGKEGPLLEILNKRKLSYYLYNRSRFKIFFELYSMLRALKKLHVDILHIHHIGNVIALRSAIKKLSPKMVVYTEHANYNIRKKAYLQQAIRDTQKYVSSITTVSENLKKYFVEDLGVDPEFVTDIPNGVDTIKFKPGPKTKKLLDLIKSDEVDTPVFISVGRLTEAKDYPNLLKAFKDVVKNNKAVRLVIVGDGELRQTLLHLITEYDLEDNVIMAGRRIDVDQLLPGCDGFILSSKREGLPVAILEAMSCGLPVIATSVGAVPDVVKNEKHGTIIPPEKADALKAAMQYALKNLDSFKSLGANARLTIEEKFSMQAIAEQYMEIYDQDSRG